MLVSEKTAVELIKKNAKKIPKQTFLQFNENTYTYSELNQFSGKVANHLRNLGIKKGDHVALMMKNCPEFIWIWFGIAKLGAVMVPININIKGNSLRYILQHSDSKLLIANKEFLEIINSAFLSNPALKPIELEFFMTAALQEKSVLKKSPSIKVNDPMAIIYTSGTTGVPKGVVLPHFSYVHTGSLFVEEMMNITTDDTLFTCLPLFHLNAQQLSVMGALVAGIKLVLSERFSASSFWQEVYESKATIFNYIGSMLTILYKQPYSPYEKIHSVNRSFGAAAPEETWSDIEERFGFTIIEGYGLTETGTMALCNPPENIKVGSIGKAVRHVNVKIFDENNQELPSNQDGEIVVQQKMDHTMFQSYFRMPEKTSEAMEGGWFHTGDRGFMDEDGYFYFKDRMKDCIRYRGENISSFEIERVVNNFPEVFEGAAIGVPSEVGEEDVKVVLQLQPSIKNFDYERFIRYCEQELAYYMIPRYIEIKETLPKTATQRTQKYVLKEEGIGNSWDREKSGIKLKRKSS
ncbi:ATP-dependent acyl-CoA ligase [Chengkuizengella axinellae]|uniref:ATP-dependent acyl-CoA ligase n=1 Tax=Chengkuizengella axinellae TaxID=3064388 RepID=A0ABT9J2A7_9BACL|nr:ATP-dependent acyl-CoA ligase [Chengkuizengella sp. 2205SS18-9]MDP5275623.1 ATP-dependent acyl-CoA ligase [Chengkuizengella sp. 2205SS18-9]